jgi:hypothetical protein
VCSAVACSAVTKKANDLTTVTLGSDVLSPVQIERTMMLGPERLPGCLNISLTLPSSNTTVAMQSTDSGCTLTVGQPDLTLFDEQDIEKARNEIGSFDVDGVQSGEIIVQKVELWDADGTPLSLSQYVASLSVQVDGETLLDKTAASALEGNAGVTSQLPDSIIEKLKSSVKNGQPATADVSLTLWLQAQTLTNLPGALKMNLVLQPELEVNLAQAL